jgi:hypothetical protein
MVFQGKKMESFYGIRLFMVVQEGLTSKEMDKINIASRIYTQAFF